MERTLSIIKPDAVRKGFIGPILTRLESTGLHIIALKMVQLSKKEAGQFYFIHRERPFFHDLVSFMISGPVVISILEGDSAVSKNREIMGETDPQKAKEGTIRRDFAHSIEENAVHGSDSLKNAREEIMFFFPEEKGGRE